MTATPCARACRPKAGISFVRTAEGAFGPQRKTAANFDVTGAAGKSNAPFLGSVRAVLGGQKSVPTRRIAANPEVSIPQRKRLCELAGLGLVLSDSVAGQIDNAGIRVSFKVVLQSTKKYTALLCATKL
jgi:hypothetical protein